MKHTEIYHQIAHRTGGDIYIGVVGPVRTGKSTFIRRFMEQMVLPGMEDSSGKDRLLDALPQSASGRTIMTTQMQFIPEEAAQISLGDSGHCRIRMVDCVGYLADNALGAFEEDLPRMVQTPWHTEPLPFAQAAEEGTRRVICDHSTMAIVVTSDGTPTALRREQLAEPERRVIEELQKSSVPFAIVLNTLDPEASSAQELAEQLTKAYDVPVMAMNVQQAGTRELTELLRTLLYEFPACELSAEVPDWLSALPREHWLWQKCMAILRDGAKNFRRLRDYTQILALYEACEDISETQLLEILPSVGTVRIRIAPREALYYEILSETCGTQISDQAQLMGMMRDLVHAKKEYDRMASALQSVRSTGYGVVAPSMEELTLEAPEMVRQGTQFGVRLRASAPSWHILRVDVAAEVSPAVGTEKQSEKLVASLLDAFKTDPESIWETEIFGRSLADLVRDGLSTKLRSMPETAQTKMRGALSRIVSDEGGGLMVLWL